MNRDRSPATPPPPDLLTDRIYRGLVATIKVDGEDLVLHLSWREKIAGFHANLRAPLTAVRSVKVLAKPWMELRGWRMAGITITGRVGLGTRRHGDGFDFCALHGERPAVQVELASGRFGRWVVSVPEGGDVLSEAARVAAAAGISLTGGL
jgi:hypothetical protein